MRCTSEACQLATALKLEFQLMIHRRTLQLIIHPHVYCIMKQTFFFFYKTHIITITQLLQFALVFNPIKRPQYSFGPPSLDSHDSPPKDVFDFVFRNVEFLCPSVASTPINIYCNFKKCLLFSLLLTVQAVRALDALLSVQ